MENMHADVRVLVLGYRLYTIDHESKRLKTADV